MEFYGDFGKGGKGGKGGWEGESQGHGYAPPTEEARTLVMEAPAFLPGPLQA
jgi:hypothetical protein